MRAEVVPYRLPLKRPWVAASATLTERRGALLKLTDAEGRIGWGDCAPLPSGGNADAVLDALDAYTRRPAGADFSRLPPEVRWAIETAQADLAAQRAGLPLWRHLGGTTGTVAINAALGPLDENLPARLAAAIADGFTLAKIKVGLAPVDTEIAWLKALATPIPLRLDANRAWHDDDAQHFLTAIADLPIDSVEEPLIAPTPAKLAALQAQLPYALAIDESLPLLGIARVLKAHAVRRLVLKPARLGGIAATQAMAAQAATAGVAVVLTTVVDSAIGVAATAHLAAAISPQQAHGLGTSSWLASDVATPPTINNGTLLLPTTAGLSIKERSVIAFDDDQAEKE